jgi:hypothetical protein
LGKAKVAAMSEYASFCAVRALAVHSILDCRQETRGGTIDFLGRVEVVGRKEIESDAKP